MIFFFVNASLFAGSYDLQRRVMMYAWSMPASTVVVAKIGGCFDLNLNLNLNLDLDVKE